MTIKVNPLKALFRLVFPNQCSACKSRLLDNEQYLCNGCLTTMLMDTHQSSKRVMVTKVLKNLPEIVDYNMLFYYNKENNFSSVIQRIKYNNKPKLGTMLGEVSATELAKWFEICNVDALVPIPLHAARERKRGFNQSMMIAQGISNKTHIPILNDAIVRTKNNKTQTHKNAAERSENVKGIFHVVHPEKVIGRRLMLIDDVMTTGSTINECAKTIKSADSSIELFAFTLSKADDFFQ